MRDTKNLQVRAELCASCHVGGKAKDVNHDLLAAGHPPLRFELTAYHRKLTSHDSSGKQSHWNDARERIATTEFEVKLWDAGQIASARASMRSERLSPPWGLGSTEPVRRHNWCHLIADDSATPKRKK